jgi:hypothetical protein
LRFGFGTSVSATTPRLQLTVGTSTNGSGVLGGTALSTIDSTGTASSAQTTDTARQSYMCAVAGFFGFNWKVASGIDGSFWFCRTCDNTGAPSATGGAAHWGLGGTSSLTKRQNFRFAATAAAYTARSTASQGAIAVNPGAVDSTTVGADVQAMLCFMITPRVQPLFGICGVRPNELAAGGTFTATLVGNTARTYLTLSGTSGPANEISTGTTGGLNQAMLWE